MVQNKTSKNFKGEILKAYVLEFFAFCRRLRKNRGASLAAILLCLIFLIALFAPLLAPHDPNEIDPLRRLSVPGESFFCGTDGLGRDVFSRIVYGTRLSLEVSGLVVFFTLIIGSVLGFLAGYFKRVDDVLMRVLDGFMAFPGIVLNIGIMAALGPSVPNVVFALSFGYIPRMARVVRGAVLVEKNKTYVDAARVIGAGHCRIFGHIFPNCLAPVIVQATMTFAYATLAEASLSFLGVGVPPEIPSWGNILAQGRVFIRTAPWITGYAGVAIIIFVLSINMFGDGLRDVLDPKLRR